MIIKRDLIKQHSTQSTKELGLPLASVIMQGAEYYGFSNSLYQLSSFSSVYHMFQQFVQVHASILGLFFLAKQEPPMLFEHFL